MSTSNTTASIDEAKCEKEIRLAVGRGRKMVNEMVGVVQLKKYRTMRRRYGQGNDVDAEEKRIRDAIAQLAQKASQ